MLLTRKQKIVAEMDKVGKTEYAPKNIEELKDAESTLLNATPKEIAVLKAAMLLVERAGNDAHKTYESVYRMLNKRERREAERYNDGFKSAMGTFKILVDKLEIDK